MLTIRWKFVTWLMFAAAFFAYSGIYLLGHAVKAYVHWGYPQWSHFIAGGLFLSASIFLPFLRTRRIGAFSGLWVLIPTTMTCVFHGDYGHAIQGIALIALLGWLVRDGSP